MRYFRLPEIVICGLVAYRLARVIAHDKIGEPIRNRTYKASVEHGRAGRWLNSLATCPFCLSVWFSTFVVLWFAWLVAPTWPGWGEILMAIPAAAGAAAILSAIDLALTTYVHKHPA